MHRWWILLAWVPLASATDLWVKQQDSLSRALAQQFLPELSQALGSELRLRLAQDSRDLRAQVAQSQGIGWGHVGSESAALYSVQTGLLSRQDFPIESPTGRIGYVQSAPWVAELKLRYPDVTWVAYRTPNTGLLGVATAEVDGFAGTLSNISSGLASLQLNSVKLSPLPYPALPKWDCLQPPIIRPAPRLEAHWPNSNLVFRRPLQTSSQPNLHPNPRAGWYGH